MISALIAGLESGSPFLGGEEEFRALFETLIVTSLTTEKGIEALGLEEHEEDDEIKSARVRLNYFQRILTQRLKSIEVLIEELKKDKQAQLLLQAEKKAAEIKADEEEKEQLESKDKKEEIQVAPEVKDEYQVRLDELTKMEKDLKAAESVINVSIV